MGLSQTTAKTQEGEKTKTQEPCAAEAVEDEERPCTTPFK